ncbi:hypothetical protein HYT26_04650 [Candidatus Pacearchaeota archaeon]|nr:hypothetical protein [Candidatus Pacearchaeota archaeon]
MKNNQIVFLGKEDRRNLVDFIWIVEAEAQRFKDNFRGLIAYFTSKDIISIDALWLNYKPNTKTRKTVVLEHPYGGIGTDSVEENQGEMLKDFSYFTQMRLHEVTRIAQKGISLNLIHKLPCPEYTDFSQNSGETSFEFEHFFKPLELRRQLALLFLRKRVFENQKIKPENIFYSAKEIPFVSGSDWLGNIEEAYNEADKLHNQFMPKKASIRTLALEYLSVENIFSKKILPEEYRRKLVPREYHGLVGLAD